MNRMPGGMVASRMAAGPFRQQQPNYMASTTNSLFSDSRMFSPTPSLMQSRMTNQPAASLLNSGLPPPTSYHTELATIGGLGNAGLMGEFAAADMSMSALYLHNLQHRNNLRRPSVGLYTFFVWNKKKSCFCLYVDKYFQIMFVIFGYLYQFFVHCLSTNILGIKRTKNLLIKN